MTFVTCGQVRDLCHVVRRADSRPRADRQARSAQALPSGAGRPWSPEPLSTPQRPAGGHPVFARQIHLTRQRVPPDALAGRQQGAGRPELHRQLRGAAHFQVHAMVVECSSLSLSLSLSLNRSTPRSFKESQICAEISHLDALSDMLARRAPAPRDHTLREGPNNTCSTHSLPPCSPHGAGTRRVRLVRGEGRGVST